MKMFNSFKFVAASGLALLFVTVDAQAVPVVTDCDLVLNTGATECGDDPMGEIERCPDVQSTSCPSFCEETTNDPPRCWNSDQYDWQDTAITVVNGPTDPGVTKYPVGPKKLRKGIANHLVCYDVFECSCSIDLNIGLYRCFQDGKCGAGTLLRLVRDTEECVVVEDPNGDGGPGNP